MQLDLKQSLCRTQPSWLWQTSEKHMKTQCHGRQMAWFDRDQTCLLGLLVQFCVFCCLFITYYAARRNYVAGGEEQRVRGGKKGEMFLYAHSAFTLVSVSVSGSSACWHVRLWLTAAPMHVCWFYSGSNVGGGNYLPIWINSCVTNRSTLRSSPWPDSTKEASFYCWFAENKHVKMCVWGKLCCWCL